MSESMDRFVSYGGRSYGPTRNKPAGPLARLRRWLRAVAPDPVVGKLLLVYGTLGIALAAGLVTGVLQPALHAAGWVRQAVLALLVGHVVLALSAARDPYPVRKAAWLAKIDASLLTVGFLGKLGAIATVTGSLTATDAAGAVAGLGRLTQGISAALYATMLGLGVAAVTHCATMVIERCDSGPLCQIEEE